MWMMWIAAAIIVMTGYYSVNSQVQNPTPAPMQSMALAGNMGIYRAAVVAYATSNPAFTGTVADGNLPFPTWYTPLTPSLWRNYIAADGTITIYASALPTIKITSDIVSLSKNSILAGEARSATGTLYSPAAGDTGILLPAGVVIPNGSPVWMSSHN